MFDLHEHYRRNALGTCFSGSIPAIVVKKLLQPSSSSTLAEVGESDVGAGDVSESGQEDAGNSITDGSNSWIRIHDEYGAEGDRSCLVPGLKLCG